MAKERTLEQIESQMAKLREKKDALHAELQSLAAERRKVLESKEKE